MFVKRLPGALREEAVQNEYGKAIVYVSDAFVFLPRHGNNPKSHILPHMINHPANLKALKDLGVREVIGVNSTGSLKINLKPGMMVVPDDFISLAPPPTIFRSEPVHITPGLSEKIRRKWVEAAGKCGIEAVDGGVYWQTSGPRLETRAEIRFMSQIGDIVGMTMASEAVIAKELEMEYASLCSVDNYAHGLAERALTMEEILNNSRRNLDIVFKIVLKYLEGRQK
ncbi:MAG: MTAP family purine nucleoside phosphorylase [Syntrophales bacterium]